jgi:hypothetical protein
MRTLRPLPRLTLMKHLSSVEQKMLMAARRHRADYLRRIRQMKAFAGVARQILIIAACAAGFFSGTTNARAAGAATVSAPAFFNEANAAQRAGHPGPAILGYERARLLAPHDPSVAENLRLAREKAGVSAPAVAAWQRPAHALSIDGLALLASISLLLCCLLVFGMAFLPPTLRSLARVATTALGMTVLLAAAGVALRWPELDRAVILGAPATAHIAPAASSISVFELKPGDLVTARREHGDFVLIRTLDQRSGWVARADVERIIPPSGALSRM